MSFLQKELDAMDSSIEKPLEKRTDKILFTGLSQTGKSSIIQVVFDGIDPEISKSIPATVKIKRKLYDFSGQILSVFDLGGQLSYLEELYSKLRKSVFADINVLFFVVDVTKLEEMKKVKHYFDRAIDNLNKYSKGAKITILCHKTDLLKKEQNTKISQKIRDVLDIRKSKNIKIFKTSIYEKSIFTAINRSLNI